MHEKIKIKIGLTAEFWDCFPMIDMIINGDTISRHIVDQKTYCIENTVNLQMNRNHLLQIRRYNKSDDQCIVIDGEKKDQYVIINDMIIDGINVQNLMWDKCWYEPQYPEIWARQQKDLGIDLELKVISETWLSHNGMWNFEFSSPFYKFLIAQFKKII